MKLSKTAKVIVAQSNGIVNIPKEHRQALNLKNGDTVLFETDTEKQIMILRKVGD